MMFPPPCFTVGMVFLGFYSSFFLQTRRVEFIPKSYILVSSDLLPCLLWIIQIVFGKLQMGLDMCCLSRGTLRVLQNFNPWRCTVLLMVTVETVFLIFLLTIPRYCLVSLLASQAHQYHGHLTNFWCFWQCGQVPNPAGKWNQHL